MLLPHLINGLGRHWNILPPPPPHIACVSKSQNASARAEVGMYGDIGSIGLTGPRGKLGQYVDLPADQEVIRLFNQGKCLCVGQGRGGWSVHSLSCQCLSLRSFCVAVHFHSTTYWNFIYIYIFFLSFFYTLPNHVLYTCRCHAFGRALRYKASRTFSGSIGSRQLATSRLLHTCRRNARSASGV